MEDLATTWDQLEHAQATFGPEGNAAALSLFSGKFLSPKSIVLLVWRREKNCHVLASWGKKKICSYFSLCFSTVRDTNSTNSRIQQFNPTVRNQFYKPFQFFLKSLCGEYADSYSVMHLLQEKIGKGLIFTQGKGIVFAHKTFPLNTQGSLRWAWIAPPLPPH